MLEPAFGAAGALVALAPRYRRVARAGPTPGLHRVVLDLYQIHCHFPHLGEFPMDFRHVVENHQTYTIYIVSNFTKTS